MQRFSTRLSGAIFVCGMLVSAFRGLAQAQSTPPAAPGPAAPAASPTAGAASRADPVASPADPAASTSPAAAASTPAASRSAPCPVVEALLAATIDTKKVKPGELFRFSTIGPITYDGGTIPAATPGVGFIATSDHSKSQGHSGYLVLEARYLERADGSHVPVTFMPGDDGHSQAFERAGSSSAGLLGLLPFYIGTAAGVYNAFHHGKDAAVVAGTHLRLIVGDALYRGACSAALGFH